MEVVFRAVYPWALLPRKIKIDPKAKQEEARLIEENFRWLRISRSQELCWPWRIGQEIGWVIDSPVTVAMDALHDVEVACPPEMMHGVSQMANSSENWHFNNADGSLKRLHCTRMAGWLALYDFRNGDHFDRMFFVNGQGSVEWVMGWEVRIPPQYFLMLMPYATIPNLEVLVGVLNAKGLQRPDHNGISIAVRPTGPATLTRGQPIARMILLHPDTLKLKANIESDAAVLENSPIGNQAPASTDSGRCDSATRSV
jgi:hypothetical protein